MPKLLFNFSGSWISETETSAFNLSLSQSNGRITGSHCSVQMAGDRIDCILDKSEKSLMGSVQNNSSIIVSFKSNYSGKSGTAKIIRINDSTINWQILIEPKGEYYIPKHSILRKEK